MPLDNVTTISASADALTQINFEKMAIRHEAAPALPNIPAGMDWVVQLNEKYVRHVKNHPLFDKIEKFNDVKQFEHLVRQLYHLSREFGMVLASRYANCKDFRYMDCFAQHLQEELDHPLKLINWMKTYGILGENESVSSVSPNFETTSTYAYWHNVVLRGSIEHQVLSINLVGESAAEIFHSRVNHLMHGINVSDSEYFHVHEEADVEHQLMGLDIMPSHSQNSSDGKEYARVIHESWECMNKMFYSWGEMMDRFVPLPLFFEERA